MSKDFYLTAEQIESFRKNGYMGPFDLYDEAEAKQMYRQIRAQLFDRSKAIYQLPVDSVIAGYDRHFDVNLLSEHIARKEIVHRVSSILGPDVICWRSETFPKYPGDEGTDWHQADTYAHASGIPQIRWPDDQFGGAITVWTAFTDATEENGCLRFIPGTHEEMFYDESLGMEFDATRVNAVEKQGMKRGFFGYDYTNLQKDPNWVPPESDAISMEMKAGQFVIFWSTLMHASWPNSTEHTTRMGFASRYLPTCVEVYPEVDDLEEYGSKISLDDYGVVVVEGEDRFHHNRIAEVNKRGVRFVA
ncbi:MAG: chlorinating enzyme [Wenzhouxiangellaceae bacterium]